MLREQLLTSICRKFPELQPEDAFVVPQWFIQQEAWVTDSVNSDSAAYNTVISLRLRGPLNPSALKKSIESLVRQHPVLRSIVRPLDGRLVQIVLAPQPVAMPFNDLRGDGVLSSRELKATELVLADARELFDLTQGPLLRARLIQLEAADHVLALTTHLLFCDDWSTGIVVKDLLAMYRAAPNGDPVPQRGSAFQYADFARDLDNRIHAGDMEPQIEFWVSLLGEGPAVEYLKPRSARKIRRLRPAACETVLLSEDLLRTLKSLSQAERVSLFMTLLAGFDCLLYSYSGAPEITIGSCAANRPRADVEELVGRFGNDLVLRVDVSGNPTFRELLRRVRDASLNAYSHQEVPFGKVLASLPKAQNGHSDSSLQVMFIFQNAPKETVENSDLSVERFPIDAESAKYDLNVWLRLGENLEITFEYDRDLFPPEEMKGILASYRAILELMVQNPETRLNEVRPATATKLDRHSVQRSDSPSPAVPNDSIEHKLVEIWEGEFGRTPINVSADFFELGGDSIMAARLFPKMEQAFQIKLPLSSLFKASSIREIAKIVREARRQDAGSSLLVTIQPLGSRLPLFCFHGAGGNVLIYRELSRHLGSDRPFYGLQSQGLEGDKPFLTSIEDMAAVYLDEIRRVQPDGPYMLGGYCMGGIIALEVAQRLYATGEKVAMLALFDTINWSKVRTDAAWSEPYHQAQRLGFHIRNFLLLNPRNQFKFFAGKLNVLRRRAHVWRGMLASKASANGENDRSESSKLAKAWVLNEEATMKYVPRPYPGIITDFRPRRQYARYVGPDLNWEKIAQGGCEIVTLPVFPAGMLMEPFVKDLASELSVRVGKALATSHLSEYVNGR
jgi:thioesterase domain-containing protein/acyl carrier protein